MFAVWLKFFRTLLINTTHPKFPSYVCVTIQKNQSLNINALRLPPPFRHNLAQKNLGDPHPSRPKTTFSLSNLRTFSHLKSLSDLCVLGDLGVSKN